MNTGLRPVKLNIDGQEVRAMPRRGMATMSLGRTATLKEGPTTIYQAATDFNINIPILCHREHLQPVAVCRACCVEIGPGKLVPACQFPISDGMTIKTHRTSERVKEAIKVVVELLLSDYPSATDRDETKGKKDELLELARELGLSTSSVRFPRAPERRKHDESSLVISVDHNACILCDRCSRGCNDVRNNQILGRAGKGYKATIAFDLNQHMGDSGCVACGECVISCPTGALTHRGVGHIEVDKGAEVIEARDMEKHHLFQGISDAFLKYNVGAIVRRRYKDGEIICREGEYGNTAYLIDKGSVEVYITSSMSHVGKGGGGGGFLGLFRKVAVGLVGGGKDKREDASTSRYIQIDGPVSLDKQKPVAMMTEGDLFGEMACMTNAPRSATVRAKGDVVVFEMLRNVLYMLRRSSHSRKWIEARFRQNSLSNHLRTLHLFASILDTQSEFDRLTSFLKERAELVRKSPGEVIFRQDDPADAFYSVRIGFVKVSQNLRGGEHVLTYSGPGQYFGEIGLMTYLPELQGRGLQDTRTASVTALDHVDLMRVNKDDFRRMLEMFPSVKKYLIEKAVKTLDENKKRNEEMKGADLGDFLSQGLMHAKSVLVLDLEKCTRCDECTKACADAHDGVTRLIRDGLRFDKFLVASSCRSCIDPYCLAGCPVDSIHRVNSREIMIEDWCIGCGQCSNNCPYGNINMHTFPTGQFTLEEGKKVPVLQSKATTCDLCTSLDGQPSCVYACPHDAAHRMTGEDLRHLVEATAKG